MEENISDAAFIDKEMLQKARIGSQGFSRNKSSPIIDKLFDMTKVWRLLEGSIDVHVHGGPDAYNTRVYDEYELAVQACNLGMKAVVFKCHSAPSVRSSYIVQKLVNRWAEDHGKEKIDIFGGVVLNYSVGGLNENTCDFCINA